ncbi:MAG: preprotein translocase subunit SecG [Gammaproteobacteria bacterium]|nr:preprotein translocase subunit SecG [Gammaproteobacteria bacterium]
MHTFLMIVQVFSSAGIVALVLLQRGKGADAGAGFGSGASGTVFGARGARTALSRATAVLAAVFMVNSLALAYMGTRQEAAPASRLDLLGGDHAGDHTGSAPPAGQELPKGAEAPAPAGAAPHDGASSPSNH